MIYSDKKGGIMVIPAFISMGFKWLVSKFGEPLTYIGLAIIFIALALAFGEIARIVLYALIIIGVVLVLVQDNRWGKIADAIKGWFSGD